MDAVGGRIELEPPHPPRVGGILDVDDVVAATGAQREDMILGDEEVVDAAREHVRVLGEHRHALARVPDTENNNAVSPVGRPFAADDRDVAALRHLDIVDGAGVDLDLPYLADVGRIGDVPDVGRPVRAPRPGHGVVAPVGGFPDPQVRRVAVEHAPASDHFDLPANIAAAHLHRPAGGVRTGGRDHDIRAGTLGHEPAVGRHQRGRARGDDGRGRLPGHGELHGNASQGQAARILGDRGEDDDVARANRLRAGLQRQRRDRARLHLDYHCVGGVLGAHRQLHRARPRQGEEAVAVDARDRRVGARMLDGYVVAHHAARIDHLDGQPRMGADVELRRNRGESDAFDGRLRHGHRDLGPRDRVGPPTGVAGVRRNERHEGELAGTVGLDVAAPRH